VQTSSAALLEIFSMESGNMLPDMLQSLAMNPEIIAAVNKNFKSVANGSPSVSGFSAILQCVLPKIISQQKEFINRRKKMVGAPGSGSETSYTAAVLDLFSRDNRKSTDVVHIFSIKGFARCILSYQL
jgi:uncharacterized membrane-anchored protein